jgi:hypothetical protein
MPRSKHDARSAVRSLSNTDLERHIAECASKEAQPGMANKVRRSWKHAREIAEAELASRKRNHAIT